MSGNANENAIGGNQSGTWCFLGISSVPKGEGTALELVALRKEEGYQCKCLSVLLSMVLRSCILVKDFQVGRSPGRLVDRGLTLACRSLIGVSAASSRFGGRRMTSMTIWVYS